MGRVVRPGEPGADDVGLKKRAHPPTAFVLSVFLSSCTLEPPVNMAMDAAAAPAASKPPNRRKDVCAIYRSMFPASVIRQLDGLDGDSRINTRTEAGDMTLTEVGGLRARLVEASGGARSHWATISDVRLFEAFRSWRTERLPRCNWVGYAREVSAPSRKGRVGPVLTNEDIGSYTRVSLPHFIDRDTAIVLVREVLRYDVTARRDDILVTRKLVFTYRDGKGWAMHAYPFEGHGAPEG